MKSKIFIFTTLILVVFLFVITSCDNFLNAKNKTTININLDLSKILKTSRNSSSSTEYMLKIFVYDATSFTDGVNIETLPLVAQTENKVDINGNVKASLDVAIGLNVIFVAKLYQGKSEKPLYAGKSEVIKIKAIDNKVHLVLTRENADLDIDVGIEEHEHTFAEDWTSDATHHWHASTCEHTEVSGKAEHTFGDWKVTKDPTEEAEGSKERTCTVCGYTATEVIENLAHTHKFATDWTKDETHHWHAATCGHDVTDSKAEHTFGNWTTTKEATEEAEGSKERTCTVCEYKVTESIEKLDHTHKFATDWTKDETNHWYAATCEHTTEVSGKAEHSFGNWTTTKEATEEETGTRERSCTVCGYTATEVIEKLAHTHKFATDWTKDETNHWYASTCGHDVTDSKAAHSFYWEVTIESSCTEKGEKKGTCTSCGYEKTEITDKEEHTYTDGICVCGLPEGFVLIPAGTFQMGSELGYDDNKPVHQVTITKSFYMGKYEVTQAEYEGYCNYGESSPTSTYGVGNNYPAYYVSWYDAIVYCNKRSISEGLTPCYSISGNTDPEKWGMVPTSTDSKWNAVVCDWNANGYRLPTEAEWEYAARAGDNTVVSYTYSGTSDVNKVGEYAWYESNSNDATHAVGTKLPNAFGLYDMSGNVYEWCWNWKTTSGYDTGEEGGSDPTGTSAGSYRLFRSSCYSDNSVFCAVSFRCNGAPYYRYNFLGFRVVRSAPTE